MTETTNKTVRYEVEVIETLHKVVTVEISPDETPVEALRRVEEMYRTEEIVLSADDYAGTEIKLIN